MHGGLMRRKRLMLIDASAIGRLAIVKQLPKDRFSVNQVSTLDEAVPFLESVQFGLVFLSLDDVIQNDRLAPLLALKKACPDAKVVITAHDMLLSEWNRCLSLGAVALLPKPFTKEALLHVLQHRLSSSSMPMSTAVCAEASS